MTNNPIPYQGRLYVLGNPQEDHYEAYIFENPELGEMGILAHIRQGETPEIVGRHFRGEGGLFGRKIVMPDFDILLNYQEDLKAIPRGDLELIMGTPLPGAVEKD